MKTTTKANHKKLIWITFFLITTISSCATFLTLKWSVEYDEPNVYYDDHWIFSAYDKNSFYTLYLKTLDHNLYVRHYSMDGDLIDQFVIPEIFDTGIELTEPVRIPGTNSAFIVTRQGQQDKILYIDLDNKTSWNQLKFADEDISKDFDIFSFVQANNGELLVTGSLTSESEKTVFLATVDHSGGFKYSELADTNHATIYPIPLTDQFLLHGRMPDNPVLENNYKSYNKVINADLSVAQESYSLERNDIYVVGSDSFYGWFSSEHSSPASVGYGIYDFNGILLEPRQQDSTTHRYFYGDQVFYRIGKKTLREYQEFGLPGSDWVNEVCQFSYGFEMNWCRDSKLWADPVTYRPAQVIDNDAIGMTYSRSIIIPDELGISALPSGYLASLSVDISLMFNHETYHDIYDIEGNRTRVLEPVFSYIGQITRCDYFFTCTEIIETSPGVTSNIDTLFLSPQELISVSYYGDAEYDYTKPELQSFRLHKWAK